MRRIVSVLIVTGGVGEIKESQDVIVMSSARAGSVSMSNAASIRTRRTRRLVEQSHAGNRATVILGGSVRPVHVTEATRDKRLPLRRPEQLRDIPTPQLVGPAGQ